MRLHLLALTIAALVMTAPAFAGDGKGNSHGHGKGKGGCGELGRVFCPHCGDPCYPTVTKGKETKHCWNVDSKTICIPKVRFPWESCGKGKGGKNGCPPPKCGRTKQVNVLVKHEYECSTCKYSWDPDAFKNGKGDDKYDAYKAGPAPGEEDAEPVPEPPPVEARRPIRRQQPVPVRFAPVAPADESTRTVPKKSYAEILTSFFK